LWDAKPETTLGTYTQLDMEEKRKIGNGLNEKFANFEARENRGHNL